MVVNPHQHGSGQGLGPECKMLIPLWIQVSVYNGTSVFEGRTLELDIRVTASCRRERSILSELQEKTCTKGTITIISMQCH